MPTRNRVTPFGEILATPERGTMMGNRGILHDAEGRIRRAWQVKRWLLCVLEFKERHRTVMTPNRYTELFFLDEAVSLAAGHRPCAECRRPRYHAFRAAWGVPPPSADEMDRALHPARIDASRAKVSLARAAQFPARRIIRRNRRPALAGLG